MRRILSVLVMGVSALAAAEQFELNAPIPENAYKVAEHRFRSPTDFEGTLKFYKTALPAKEYPRKNICNQPGVKALHIVNASGKGGWEGLNIYEANDEVRIYVVPADGSAKKREKKVQAGGGK
jgi:hypothetical protein